MIEGLMIYCPKPTQKIIKVGKPKGRECAIYRHIYIKNEEEGKPCSS